MGIRGLSSKLILALGASSAAASSVLPRQSNSSSPDISPYFQSISDYVDSIVDELWPINQEIHDNPELGYEEVEAHKLLTDFMEAHEGWNVTRSIYNISTAFVAVFEGSGDGPIVSFNAEYGKWALNWNNYHQDYADPRLRCSSWSRPCVRP